MVTSSSSGYASQALARLTDEMDRLGNKIDRMAGAMATRDDLARYALRETVEARWSEFDRRQSETRARLDLHDVQIASVAGETFKREARWDWRIISAMGCLIALAGSVLGTIVSGTVTGVLVWHLTH
jgi:hypothetical protein